MSKLLDKNSKAYKELDSLRSEIMRECNVNKREATILTKIGIRALADTMDEMRKRKNGRY